MQPTVLSEGPHGPSSLARALIFGAALMVLVSPANPLAAWLEGAPLATGRETSGFRGLILRIRRRLGLAPAQVETPLAQRPLQVPPAHLELFVVAADPQHVEAVAAGSTVRPAPDTRPQWVRRMDELAGAPHGERPAGTWDEGWDAPSGMPPGDERFETAAAESTHPS